MDFYEKQRYNSLTRIICIIFGFAYLIFMYNSKIWKNSLLEITVCSLLFLMIAVFSFFTSIKTIINNEGIYVKFSPFFIKYKYYSWNEITKVYIKRYQALREYGGWGYKKRFFRNGIRIFNFNQYDKSITISGNTGLQIEFANGKKLLIGTHKHEEMAKVLEQLGKLNENDCTKV
jgi:hypothetical protein